MRLNTVSLLIALIFTFGCSSTVPYTYVDDYIIRGPMPDEAKMQELKAQGLMHYMNLMNPDDPYDAADVKALETLSDKYRVLFYNIPMSNYTRPSAMKLRWAAITLRIWNQRHELSLVTCRHGVDRTGWVVGTYRQFYQGYSWQDAYQEALSMGHHTIYDGFPLYWERSLQEVSN